ncbi:MAG TPA: dockerin type I domain-containing protein [bacterium]|nr:dockerin type I domain-containing protein [bacterium]HPQ19538.1 dockerin type I domain-containing protein [bacterium]
MKEKILFIFLLISVLIIKIFGDTGTATIDAGVNVDTIYYNKNADSTQFTDFHSYFDTRTMLYQFDIVYNTNVFIFDTNAVAPGLFLTTLNNKTNDTYLFLIFDDSRAGITTITGCRMIEEDYYKGLAGLQILVSKIKFIFKNPTDTQTINSDSIIVTNFKFYDAGGDSLNVSTDKISWRLFLKLLGGDLNNDGTVNTTDFTYFRSVFGKERPAAAYPAADINNDGIINSVDFSYFRLNFGKTENQY